MEKIKLSPPWLTLYHEIDCLFRDDSEVNVSYDEETYEIKLYVDNNAKAQALTALLPNEKVFGNISVKITVVPANQNNLTKADLFQEAFSGNPAFSYAKAVDSIMAPNFTYVVFAKKVVQFYNDNIGDIHGLESTLFQTIAKDVFKDDAQIKFCTDI
ncbi:MAG: hypothetical protein IJJ25_00240 [Lachnospiraceae bacterium]|nr:hypothetical protein [Lachnospiraceae bacterium]MBQ6482747.1 hypothetical protein [Anaerolineaceae bacterium]